MSRSLKKGPYVDPRLLQKFQKSRSAGSTAPIKTWSRRSTIVPDFIGQRFLVHTGKDFTAVMIREEMVGHKLGEFAPTRVFRGHPGNRAEEKRPAGGAPGAPGAPAAPAAPGAPKA